jgi:hypothetical protein
MPQHPAQPPHALDHNAYQHHQHPAQGGGHAGYGREPAPEDTQNWDLSHYSASHGLRNPHAAGAPHDSRAPQVQPGYDAYGQLQGGHGHAHGGAPGYDHAGAARRGQQPVDPYAQDPGNAHYQAQPGYGQDAFQQGGQPLQGQGYDQDPGYEPEPEYEEPERRGPRPMLVVAALVGAIAVGGGLAYGYRMFSGGKPSGKPPIVKADSTPAKAKPAEPGGKEEAHKDKKFVNRLGEQPAQQSAVASGSGAAPQAVASAPADPEAPRKVTTLIVNKDGTITPQAQPLPAAQPPAAPPPAPVAPQPVGSVPGMVVEGFPPRPPVRQAAVEPPVTPVAKAPPVADLPLPKARAATAVSEPKADTPPPAKKKPAQRDDLLASKSAAPAAGAAPVANQGAVIGFVPVLASKKSREEALKSFADLASKYPDVLASKAPDVIEANIPEKGLWYRTVVGPPGSREAAREVCGKLETAGFKGCWVTAYRQ